MVNKFLTSGLVLGLTGILYLSKPYVAKSFSEITNEQLAIAEQIDSIYVQLQEVTSEEKYSLLASELEKLYNSKEWNEENHLAYVKVHKVFGNASKLGTLISTGLFIGGLAGFYSTYRRRKK